MERGTVSGDPLNYQAMTEEALRGVVRRALILTAQRGLLGQHHFYLTFRTRYPGVQIAEHLRTRHPEEMTIVLQHQFWGLEITDETFSVTLSFNGQHENLLIPFAAVSAFVDPSVQFGLQFSVTMPDTPALAVVPTLPAKTAPAGLPATTPPPAATPDTEPVPGEQSNRVVALDAFRKSDGRKK